jgi:hypothetical protein
MKQRREIVKRLSTRERHVSIARIQAGGKRNKKAYFYIA